MTRVEYTLKDIDECKEFIDEMYADENRKQYFNKVYSFLMKAKSGDKIDIDKVVKPSKLQDFIGVVCVYIWDSNRAEFSSDYRFVKIL